MSSCHLFAVAMSIPCSTCAKQDKMVPKCKFKAALRMNALGQTQQSAGITDDLTYTNGCSQNLDPHEVVALNWKDDLWL